MAATHSSPTHPAAAPRMADRAFRAASQNGWTMGILEQFADKRVLIVDDERNMLISLSMTLEGAGITAISTAGNGVRGLEMHEEQPFDLILLNHRMPLMTGTEMLKELRRRGDPVAVIMHTSWQREELDLEGLGLAALVSTPFSQSDYIETLRDVLSAPLARETAGLGTRQSRTRSPKRGTKT